MNFHKDVLIHGSIETIFDALIQPERVPKWAERVLKIELLDDAETLSEGVRFQQIMRYGGSEVAYPGRVDKLENPGCLRVVLNPRHCQIETEYRLSSVAEGTLVTVNTRLTQSRWLTKWLVIIFANSQRRRFEKDMEQMQQHFEEAFGEESPPPRRVAPGLEFLPGEPRPGQASEAGELY